MTGFYPRGIVLHEKLQRLVIEAGQWLRDSTVAVIIARYQADFESPASSLRRLRFCLHHHAKLACLGQEIFRGNGARRGDGKTGAAQAPQLATRNMIQIRILLISGV